MVTTAANNHRPAGTAAATTRMAKSDKTNKKPGRPSGTKPTSFLDNSPELRNTVAAIEKQFGEGAIMPLGSDTVYAIEGISTGSLSLDIALGGQGIPRGRVIEVFGPESSGKTTLALHVVAEAQKAGGIAAFIDAEHALDPSWAKKLGVDLEMLLVSQPSYGEEAMHITEMLIKSNAVDVIVIDSVAALVPKKELDGDIGDTHVGLQARLMSQSLRKLTAAIAKSRTSVIFINQIREKIGVMFGSPETTPGGRALKFYASCRIDVRRIGQLKEGEEVVGQRVRAKVVKNKVAPPFRVGRVRHAAHRRHQLRRRHPRHGHGAKGRRPHRRVVPLRRPAARPGQRKGPAVPEREPENRPGDQGKSAGRGRLGRQAGQVVRRR